jgi:hypothetical protein
MKYTKEVVMEHKLDIAKCFNEAWEVYKINVVILILSSLLYNVLMTISVLGLLIPAGPLVAGYSFMLLTAMRKDDKKVDLKDMFQMFKRFWPFAGLFFLQFLGIFAGIIMFIIPGILLMVMWLYAYYIMIDTRKGVVDSLKASWKFVDEKGFWQNLLLVLIAVVIGVGASYVPVIGQLVSLVVSPFIFLLVTSAYLQQVAKVSPVSDESRPFADVSEEGQA